MELRGFKLLTPRVPLRGSDAKRHIWASPEVYALLKGELDAGFPHLEADGFIGTYSRGWIVSASRRHQSKAQFKWLTGHHQVWVMSFRQPRPGWRIFGRFAKKGVFVAMCYFEREKLGNLAIYNQNAQDVIALWDQLFPGVSPHDGADFDDSIGFMIRDDDETS